MRDVMLVNACSEARVRDGAGDDNEKSNAEATKNLAVECV